MVSGTPKDWSLHPQLAQDTVPVGDLALSRVLLANDANYPWLILVPRRPGLTEIIDLEPNEQVQLLGEIDAAARALKSVTECEKLNIAALGNVVAQLHVHVIGRRHSDALRPETGWRSKACRLHSGRRAPDRRGGAFVCHRAGRGPESR